MPAGEIILLSSDEDAPPSSPFRDPLTKTDSPVILPVKKAPQLAKTLQREWDLDSDEDDFLSPRPKKRRRPSPPAVRNQPSAAQDPDLPPIAKTLKNRGWIDDEQWAMVDGDDSIVFTSSAHLSASATATKTMAKLDKAMVVDDEDSDSLPEDALSLPIKTSRLNAALSSRTANVLASLDRPPAMAKSKLAKGSRGPAQPKQRSVSVLDGASSGAEDGNNTVPAKKTAVRKPRQTSEERAQKQRQKESEKAAKALAREQAKEQRDVDKEEKLAQKRKDKDQLALQKKEAAAIAEVNKAKLDKKDSTAEMIVDVPISIAGEALDMNVREFLKNLGVEATTYQSPIANLFRWRRKVKAKWNERLGYWEPLPRIHIEDERHVLCWMTATEFVSKATGRDDEDLDTHVAMLKTSVRDCIPIYLIEGLTEWMRKNRSAENRAYQAQVLAQNVEGETASQPSRGRKKKPIEVVDENVVEDALLQLQVLHGCLIHHTEKRETAEWVANFTQHISTIPYKHQQALIHNASFCMEVGQVKSGEDKPDTLIKMLCEVVRVTKPMALGILALYPSVTALVNGFKTMGVGMLADVECEGSGRRVGPAVSRRLHAIFTGMNEGSREFS